MKSDAELLHEWWGKLKRDRSFIEPSWRELKELFLPFLGDFKTNGKSPVDPEGVLAASKLANFIISLVAPPGSAWVHMKPVGDDEIESNVDVAKVLGNSSRKVLSRFRQSRFYMQLGRCLKSFMTFGNCAVAIGRKKDKDGNFEGLRFQSINIENLWWKDSGDGEIRLIARRSKPTAIQAHKMYPDCSVAAQYVQEEKELDPVEIVEFILPVEDAEIRGVSTEGVDERFTWLSVKCCFLEGKKEVLETSGWDHQPIVIARMELDQDESYATGLGSIARSSAKTLSKASDIFLDAFVRELDPPMVVSNEEHVDALDEGRALIVGPGEGPPSMMRSGVDIPSLLALFERYRQAIQEVFMSDAINKPDTQPRSAEESIRQSVKESTALSQTAEQISNELLAPIVGASVEILIAEDHLPGLQDLADQFDKPVRWVAQFSSPLFVLQNRAAVNEAYSLVRDRAELMNMTGNRELLLDIKWDEFMKHDIVNRGISGDFIEGEAELDDKFEALAQKQALERANELGLQQLQEQGGAQGLPAEAASPEQGGLPEAV